MKTKRIITIGCLMVNVAFVSAQSWFMDLPIGNDVINPAAYLGCRATSTQSLKLKTIPDLNIDMYTSDIQRFALLPTETYATLGAYTSIIADGHLLICPDVAAFLAGGAPGPYSLQHLAAATNSSFADAYRNWARTGTTYTAGGTMAYMGLKDADKGHTDLAIQLAKRDGATAPDRIRFIFTDALNSSSTSGADSQEGLEGMRLSQTLSPTINGFTNPTDGFLLLSGQPDAFTNANSRAPFTRLHLIDDVGAVAPIVYAQEIGYRPWMRNGISFSGNSDQAYIGQRYAGDDNTDFVIQWTAQRSIFSLS